MNAITNPQDRPVKISCRNVWKIYGERPETFFAERNGRVPDPAATLASLRKAALADDTGAALSAAIKQPRPPSSRRHVTPPPATAGAAA